MLGQVKVGLVGWRSAFMKGVSLSGKVCGCVDRYVLGVCMPEWIDTTSYGLRTFWPKDSIVTGWIQGPLVPTPH